MRGNSSDSSMSSNELVFNNKLEEKNNSKITDFFRREGLNHSKGILNPSDIQ
jgi:hypothetical protein